MTSIIQQILRKNIISVSRMRPIYPRVASFSTTGTEQKFDKKEFEKTIKADKVVVFMKGNPEQPRCGFSNAVVQILRMHGVKYNAHDVLQSDELRQGIKEFTNWPTIPQVFLDGQFVGGCDILLQMHQNGDLVEELNKVGIKSLLSDEKTEHSSEKK